MIYLNNDCKKNISKRLITCKVYLSEQQGQKHLFTDNLLKFNWCLSTKIIPVQANK